MDWVFDHSKSQGLERLILLVIADHCNHEGEHAFPRISHIAKRANVSERTVKRRLNDLVALGELEVVKRTGTSNLYRILRNPDSSETVEAPKKQAKEIEKIKTRERNPIWDALLSVCGVNTDALNSSEASRYGKMVKLLNESKATPEEIFARAEIYRNKFQNAVLTPTALVNRWSECDPNLQEMNGLKGVVPKGWNAIKAARDQRAVSGSSAKGELSVR